MISFQGIGREVVTVNFAGALHRGDLCYFLQDKCVAAATSTSGFAGKVIDVFEDGTASVQIRGYVEAGYSTAAAISGVGYKKLACRDATNVQQDDDGREYLVVSNNENKRVIGIML